MNRRPIAVCALLLALLAMPPQAQEWLRWLARAASQGGEIGARYAALAASWPVAAAELER